MIFLIEFLHIYIYIYIVESSTNLVASRSLAHLLFIWEIFLVFLQLHIYLESTDVATGGAAPTSDAAQRGCDGWCHCQDIGAASEIFIFIFICFIFFYFFFFHFWICADSRRLGPICANLDWIELYQPVENDRFRPIPALNQAEIQVKIIIFIKKVQKHL